MSSGEIRDKNCAKGLKSFISRISGVQRVSIDHDFSNLLCFFGKASTLLRAKSRLPTQPTRLAFDIGNLSATIARLRTPLSETRRGGGALNVWTIAGLRRNELRNAAVLAWFLDPFGSHGLGSKVLSAFLISVKKAQLGWTDVGYDFSRVTVQTEEWPLGSETDRVDIALDGPDFAIFIEVKIDALEGTNQLQRYADLARRKAGALGKTYGRVIYLSPRPPKFAPAGVAAVTWKLVAKVLRGVPRGESNSRLAWQFAEHIRAFL